MARAGADTSSLVTSLISTRNPEAGWGYKGSEPSNPLDTALALQVLTPANYTESGVLNPALAYLTGSQNGDGGWSFIAGDESSVFLTATVAAALQQFPQTTVVAIAVTKATAYLLATQNADGSFGPEGTAYDTAQALVALLSNGQTGSTQAAAQQNAVNYLTTAQVANGSWNDDPFTTALAVKALYLYENRPAPPPPPPAAGIFTGTIIDSVTRQKVTGMTVTLASNALVNTVTDNTGVFTLRDVPPGSQTVNFSKAGYAAKSAAALSIADVTVNLGEIAIASAFNTGTISGTISDQSGRPVSGAAITVTGAWSGSCTTATDGTFSFAYVAPGDVTITVAKSGYQSYIATGRVYPRTTLSIAPRLSSTEPTGTTGSIIGRVVDDLWGYPIDHLPEDPGARVTISGGAHAVPDPDNDGRFSFTGLAPNTYQVTVGMNGYTSQTFRVIVTPGVVTDLGTIHLAMAPSSMTLMGKVTDGATGQPLTEAELYIPETGQTARSDFAGTYAIANIYGWKFNVRVARDGYVTKTITLSQSGAHGSAGFQTLDVTLMPRYTKGDVTARIIDALTGQPLAGATLVPASTPDSGTTTGADGTVTLHGLPMGVQPVTITLAGYTSRTLSITVIPGKVNSAGDITLAVPLQGAVIRGTVTDAVTGGPFAGARIRLSGMEIRETFAAEDGTYLLDNLIPGNVSVEISATEKTGYFPARILTPLAEGGILVFSPTLAIALPDNLAITLMTDKPVYTRGDTTGINATLVNREAVELAATMRLLVTAPDGSVLHDSDRPVSIPSDGTITISAAYPLPSQLQGGIYRVTAELYDPTGIWLGTATTDFGVAVSRITVTPNLPQHLATGANSLLFNLDNSGELSVSAGVFRLSLVDPDGRSVAGGEQQFSLNKGESKTLAIDLKVPALKFGNYTLVYSQSDETRDGVPVTIALPHGITVSSQFDSNSHRIRQTTNLTVTLANSGRFAFDTGVTVEVSIPDAQFSETKTIPAMPTDGSSLVFSIPIPATVPAGDHITSITATLPSGSSVTSGARLVIFESSLALAPLADAAAAGATVTATITNTGGVDTQVQFKVSLADSSSKLIAETGGTETVMAGSPLALPLTVPAGATEGAYTLTVNFKDLTTAKEEIVNHPLAVSGVKGTLQATTSKQTYLLTENITALSSLTNSGTPLDAGNLHLQISTMASSQQQKTWTSKADFQQGERNGVDTYGVNDWLIPDDDFNGTAIDTATWTINNFVTKEPGNIFVNSNNISSNVFSNWKLTGDLDIQVDYFDNISTYDQGGGLALESDTFTAGVHNNSSTGDSGDIRFGGSIFWSGYKGPYKKVGKLRLVRTGNSLATYFWNGSLWSKINEQTSTKLTSPCNVKLYAWHWSEYPTGVSVRFDNFKINKGMLKTENQITDSIRLLPLNDNFDDGVLNTERWATLNSGTAQTTETGGALVTKITPAGTPSSAQAIDRFPLTGDFDIAIDWKMPTAPATGDWNSALQISEYPPASAAEAATPTGAALQIGRAYQNGSGHQYRTGNFDGVTWDSPGAPVTTGDTEGRFRIKRAGSTVTLWYWNSSLTRWEWNGATTGYVMNNAWTNPAYVTFGLANSGPLLPAAETAWNNFKVGNGPVYTNTGTIRLKQDAGQISSWQTLTWNGAVPAGTSIRMRSRTANSEAGLAAATWSDYLSASGTAITSPKGRWIEVEAALATTNIAVTPVLNDVTVYYGSNPGDTIWQTDIPAGLAAGATADLSTAIAPLGVGGKYYLQGTLTSSTGQTIATSEYPFYVVPGNISLTLSPDRRLYKPGETVTHGGTVTNLSSASAASLVLTLKATGGGSTQTLYTGTYTIAAGASRPFTATAVAGAEGVVSLTATVVQNTATLAAMNDQYEVAAPKVSASLTGPDTAGQDPVTLTLTLVNSGKTDGVVSVATSFGTAQETVTIPAGQTKTLPYRLALTASATYTVTLSGDLSRQLVKAVTYVPPKSPPALSAKIVADKRAYNVGEKVSVTATVTCTDAGTTGDPLTARTIIVSAGGEVLYSGTADLSTPETGRTYANTRYWNSAASPPGSYTARVTVEGGGIALITAETAFTITPSSVTGAGITGTLALSANPVYQGMDQSVTLTIANNGNEDLSAATLNLLVVNPDTEAILQTITRSVALARQESMSVTVAVPTGSLADREYLAVAQVTLPAMSTAKTVAGIPFTVVIAPPPTLQVSTLPDGAITNNRTLNMTGTVTGVVAMKTLVINGNEVPLAGDGSFSHALLLQDGSTGITTVATDILDHTATDSRTISLDQQAPSLIINTPADNGKTAVSPIEVKGSVGETSTVTVKLGDTVQAAILNGTDFNAAVSPVPGWNTIEVTATDLAGNTNTMKRSVLFDDLKPSLSITEPEQDIRTNKESLTIGGKTSDPYSEVGITISMDGVILTPPVIDGIFSQVVTFSEEKLYPVLVTATNEVGTSTTAQRNVIFDKTPPVLTIDPVSSPAHTAEQVITGTREEGTIVTVSSATASVGAVEYPAPATWRVAVSALVPGENRIQAETTDLADNRATAGTTILYVPKAPEVTVTTTPNQLWPPNKKLVPVVINGAVTTYGAQTRNISISIADEYGKINRQGLKFGDTVLLEAWRDGNDKDGRIYTVTVVVTDMAGNVTTKSATVIVPHDMGN